MIKNQHIINIKHNISKIILFVICNWFNNNFGDLKSWLGIYSNFYIIQKYYNKYYLV
jgi:hypothetical protein